MKILLNTTLLIIGLWAISLKSANSQILINTQVVWDVSLGTPNPNVITNGIVVQDGGVLDISVDLLFDPNSGITVEKGGILILRSIIASPTASNFLWEGITIEGTNGTPILPIANITPIPGAPHGVVLMNNSTIRDAKIGITVGGNGNAGGLLQALSCSFINNGISIKYNEFGPTTSQTNLGNANYLRNCDFILNQTLNDIYNGGNVTKNFIYLDKFSGGLTIRGCNINTQSFTASNIATDEITGIFSTGSTQNILLDESEDETVDGVFYAGRRNTFTSLFKGVYFTSSLTGSNYEILGSDFRNADFSKVLVCFHFQRASAMNIDCSKHTVDFNNYVGLKTPEYQEYYQYQGYRDPTTTFSRTFFSYFVWVEECFDYNIRNNTVDWKGDFADWGVGVLAYNSVTGNTPTIQISNNNFLFQGTENNSTATHGCFFIGQNIETQLSCNTFVSLYRDLSLKGLIFDKVSGLGQGGYFDVLNPQGSTTRQPHNTFSDQTSTSGKLNIESDADLDYHYFGATNYASNPHYPEWQLFDGFYQAFFTGLQNSSDAYECFGTDCSPFIDKTKSELLSIFAVQKTNSINAYPNPSATGTVTVDFDKPINHIKIYNAQGKQINAVISNFKQQIIVSNLAQGIYYITMQDKNYQNYATTICIQ